MTLKYNEFYHHAKFEKLWPWNTMSSTIMQSLTFIIVTVSGKTAKLKFLPCTNTWLARQPNTDHYIDTFFTPVKNQLVNQSIHQDVTFLKPFPLYFNVNETPAKDHPSLLTTFAQLLGWSWKERFHSTADAMSANVQNVSVFHSTRCPSCLQMIMWWGKKDDYQHPKACSSWPCPFLGMTKSHGHDQKSWQCQEVHEKE